MFYKKNIQKLVLTFYIVLNFEYLQYNLENLHCLLFSNIMYIYICGLTTHSYKKQNF